jgi:hypothetical protein
MVDSMGDWVGDAAPALSILSRPFAFKSRRVLSAAFFIRRFFCRDV